MEFTWTPDGVHQDLWLSVTTSFIPRKGTRLVAEEQACFKAPKELEELYDDKNVGLVEVETGLGIVTRASL
jgi:hypothetical protein